VTLWDHSKGDFERVAALKIGRQSEYSLPYGIFVPLDQPQGQQSAPALFVEQI
jgi:hypothetical protein